MLAIFQEFGIVTEDVIAALVINLILTKTICPLFMFIKEGSGSVSRF